MNHPDDQAEPPAPPESLDGLRFRIGQYSRQLARHGRRLDEHARDLDRLQEDLDALSKQIAAGLARREDPPES